MHDVSEYLQTSKGKRKMRPNRPAKSAEGLHQAVTTKGHSTSGGKGVVSATCWQQEPLVLLAALVTESSLPGEVSGASSTALKGEGDVWKIDYKKQTNNYLSILKMHGPILRCLMTDGEIVIREFFFLEILVTKDNYQRRSFSRDVAMRPLAFH